MLFHKVRLQDARLIQFERTTDARGNFARTFCMKEFAAAGLTTVFVQQNISYTKLTGTIRGMHFQRPPHAEVKLVRCLTGAIYDVLIDLRLESPTYRQWEAYELAAGDGRRLYVPAGFAHGFQTLAPDTEVDYMMSSFYAPEAASGVRYDDPTFNISWPLAVSEISAKDRLWPDYQRSDLE
jgi:dTDP-4-dehydrorhamnose 3,5-epimerase